MASGSAPANGSPPASQSLRSTKSWTSASTNVNRCAGHLGVHTCCFRPEHASSTTISIKSSVAATPPSGDHRPPTLPPFCDGLLELCGRLQSARLPPCQGCAAVRCSRFVQDAGYLCPDNALRPKGREIMREAGERAQLRSLPPDYRRRRLRRVP